MVTTAEGRPATENDPANPEFPRSAASTLTLSLGAEGVRSSVVRLPPTTHGRGDKGFIPTIIRIAREKSASGYVGDGSNAWAAVHRADAPRAFRLALEGAPAGSVWHAVAEDGVPTRRVAEVIGRHLDLPVVSVGPEDAGEHFGWIGAFWSMNLCASSSLTRARLGWQPSGPGLIADLEQGHYFEP